MTGTEHTTVIIGAGPGLGAALGRRFAKAGHGVALVARREAEVAKLGQDIRSAGGDARPFAADASDAASLAAAFTAIRAELGDPTVLVYNAGAFERGGVMEITEAGLQRAWRIGCLGGLLAAQQVLPAMLRAKRGTILFTGATASLRGSAGFASLAIGKFGLRALAQSMAREIGPQGIHVAHVVVDGMIDSERVRAFAPGRPAEGFLAPDAIAETYFQLFAQPPSVWTHELDVRPAIEKF